MNSYSGTGFIIDTGFSPQNAPVATVISGIQHEYDNNYKWQFIHTYNSDNFFLRSFRNGNSPSWSPYCKVWHSNNLNKADADFLARTITASQINVSVLESSSPIQVLSLDVNTFSTVENANNSFFFRTQDIAAGTTSFIVKGNGNVGVGTSNPDSKLTVNGKIKAEEIEVVVDVPADYVFESSYELMSLSEVSAYIKQNKHLPNIPSAEELKRDGWQVGEMNNKLLEKVEELTLYILQLKEQNDELVKRVKALEEKK